MANTCALTRSIASAMNTCAMNRANPRALNTYTSLSFQTAYNPCISHTYKPPFA